MGGWADSRAAPNRWRSRVRDGAAASASIPPAPAAGHSAAADPRRSVAADARPGGPRLRVPSIDGTRGVPGGLPGRAPPSSTVRQPLLPAFDFDRRDCRSGRGLSHLRPRHRVRPLVSPQSPGPGEANTAPRGAAACRLTSKQPECGRPGPPSSSLARRDGRQFDQLEGGRRRPTRPSAAYRLSRLEYDRAIEAGAFELGAKLELIDGNAGREGAPDTPGTPPASTSRRRDRVLQSRGGRRALRPIGVGDSHAHQTPRACRSRWSVRRSLASDRITR